jgi:hypothetical protein
VVCSGIYLSGRQPLEVLRSSCAWMVLSDEVLRDALARKDPAAVFGLQVKIEHDAATRLVTLKQQRADGREVQAQARFLPGIGSVVLDEPAADAGTAAAPGPAGGTPGQARRRTGVDVRQGGAVHQRLCRAAPRCRSCRALCSTL